MKKLWINESKKVSTDAVCISIEQIRLTLAQLKNLNSPKRCSRVHMALHSVPQSGLKTKRWSFLYPLSLIRSIPLILRFMFYFLQNNGSNYYSSARHSPYLEYDDIRAEASVAKWGPISSSARSRTPNHKFLESWIFCQLLPDSEADTFIQFWYNRSFSLSSLFLSSLEFRRTKEEIPKRFYKDALKMSFAL